LEPTEFTAFPKSFYLDLRGRPLNSQRWFFSAILRLAGVGLPIGVKQR